MVNTSTLTAAAIVILHYLLVIYPLAITSLPPDFPPHLSSSSSSSTSSSSRGGGLLTEDKMRLGSRPPSCHNKCNLCHPCMAVQAPTAMSSQMIQAAGDDETSGIDDERDSAAAVVVSGQLWSFDGGSAGNDRYSNYKPLGWKCRCRNRIYDP